MDTPAFEESTTTTVSIGVMYPDGRVDWNVGTWFGALDTPEQRKEFAEQYRLQMATFGVSGVEVSFLSRRVTTMTFSSEQIIDTPPVLEPEPDEEAPAADPEPTPDDTADEGAPEETTPPADSETPAAPEEDVEPPAEDAPTEEESPVEESNPVGNDTESVPADNEGVATDGG